MTWPFPMTRGELFIAGPGAVIALLIGLAGVFAKSILALAAVVAIMGALAAWPWFLWLRDGTYHSRGRVGYLVGVAGTAGLTVALLVRVLMALVGAVT